MVTCGNGSSREVSRNARLLVEVRQIVADAGEMHMTADAQTLCVVATPGVPLLSHAGPEPDEMRRLRQPSLFLERRMDLVGHLHEQVRPLAAINRAAPHDQRL